MKKAFEAYRADVKGRRFPRPEHVYNLLPGEPKKRNAGGPAAGLE